MKNKTLLGWSEKNCMRDGMFAGLLAICLLNFLPEGISEVLHAFGFVLGVVLAFVSPVLIILGVVYARSLPDPGPGTMGPHQVKSAGR